MQIETLLIKNDLCNMQMVIQRSWKNKNRTEQKKIEERVKKIKKPRPIERMRDLKINMAKIRKYIYIQECHQKLTLLKQFMLSEII